MTVLLLILILLQVFQLFQFRQFVTQWKKALTPPKPTLPPKARGSFVIKRMEERLKEALYE
ncbi:MAG: hypothetical protein J6A61_06740 [Clostridia bacterium]|nr:hypothetical protein [Clostridia bacterium]